MRGLRFLGDRRLTVETLEDSTPGPGEVVIEMMAAGLCGSDLRVFRSPARPRIPATRTASTLAVGEYLIGKDLSCYGSWTFTNPELEACAAFIAREQLRLSDLATHRFAIDDAELAFDTFDRGGTGKCLFVFGDS